MKYLKRLLTILTDCFPKSDDLSTKVKDQEILSRYITSKNWFSRKNDRVKHHAYMPRPKELDLSVYRTDNLSNLEIWEIARKRIISKMSVPRSLYGRADLQAGNLNNTDLKIDPDNKPKRHANIINWPSLKEDQKIIALELAEKASLSLYNP